MSVSLLILLTILIPAPLLWVGVVAILFVYRKHVTGYIPHKDLEDDQENINNSSNIKE